MSRGSRPYNEDTFQAGTIDIPAFAKRRPLSVQRSPSEQGEAAPPASEFGDPQVFYFGVYDGHGGAECSDFLRDRLHEYIEESAKQFEIKSTLRRQGREERWKGWPSSMGTPESRQEDEPDETGLNAVDLEKRAVGEQMKPPKAEEGEKAPSAVKDQSSPPPGAASVKQSDNVRRAEELERALLKDWKELVGGYFRRFKPEYFGLEAGGQGHASERDMVRSKQLQHVKDFEATEGIGIETVLTYAFLKADYDFVSAQVGKMDEDSVLADRAINEDDTILTGSSPAKSWKTIPGRKRFKGGSTCSVAMISTPTPSPFWNPSSPCSLITSHVGDTRILLCNTANGAAVPLTSNHHPSLPQEATRLRRYAATFVTDSFGEERMSGLANTRAFGDMAHKRIGVSAEPEVRRIELSPAEYSFIVMISDGVTNALSDQEIVDIVKEARTPEQGARDLVNFATSVMDDADNATALIVRLGGWERRSEGGLGSLGTKEMRDWRKQEAESPRGRR